MRACVRVCVCVRAVVRESDADSGVTLGLLVFLLVDEDDEEDDLLPPSTTMMAHLLSLGTQSKDAAQTLKTKACLHAPCLCVCVLRRCVCVCVFVCVCVTA